MLLGLLRCSRLPSPPSNLVGVAYSLLEQKPSDWPNGGEGSSFHEPLVDSLKDSPDTSYRNLDLRDPLIIESHFIAYDRDESPLDREGNDAHRLHLFIPHHVHHIASDALVVDLSF